MTKTDKILFARLLNEVKAMPKGDAKMRRMSEVVEIVETYHAAIDLGYPRSCLDKIIECNNMRQVSNIMCSERRRQIA